MEENDPQNRTKATAHMHPTALADAEEIGQRVAAEIAHGIRAANLASRSYVLGCPSGRTPIPIYRALAAMVDKQKLDLRNVVIVMMDEYVEQDHDGSYQNVDPHTPHSCAGFAQRVIRDQLNSAASPDRTMPTENLWIPDPRHPMAYDTAIEAVGGIDLFLLATGASDGHIAFNPPGSARDSRTRVVRLSLSTRRDNMVTFPSFQSIKQVPLFGVTVGIATIQEQSRRVVMVAHGRDKRIAVEHIRNATQYDSRWPATILAECRSPSFFADFAALEPSAKP